MMEISGVENRKVMDNRLTKMERHIKDLLETVRSMETVSIFSIMEI
jgi:hypothetical protein